MIPVWLNPMWDGCVRLVMTPEVCFPFQDQVISWCRLHRLDPARTGDIVIAPALTSLAAFTYDLNEHGVPFTLDGIELAFHWTFRRVSLPPPAAWCLDYHTRLRMAAAE